jgi:hypothetical protein
VDLDKGKEVTTDINTSKQDIRRLIEDLLSSCKIPRHRTSEETQNMKKSVRQRGTEHVWWHINVTSDRCIAYAKEWLED